ncbi:MAG: hypothetical protein E2O68_02965 [Deltaproteobacteria bacterium]|nr:MAG: hypothetical protein E2O68_02965 [Deltaproteobacteria bacterium]
MKKLLTITLLLGLSSVAFAAPHHGGGRRGMGPGHHGKKFAKVVVKGQKAQAIFEALNADIVIKDRPQFTVEVKKVGSLRCAQLTKKEDTSVVKYRCVLRGKRGPRGHHRRGGRRGMRRNH